MTARIRIEYPSGRIEYIHGDKVKLHNLESLFWAKGCKVKVENIEED